MIYNYSTRLLKPGSHSLYCQYAMFDKVSNWMGVKLCYLFQVDGENQVHAIYSVKYALFHDM